MRLPLLAATIATISASCGAHQPPPVKPQGPLTAKDIYERSVPAIVRIDVEDPRGSRVGTGFIVDARGLIATNLHVVGGSDKIKIKLSDGREYDVREVFAFDEARDLALLEIHAPAALPTLKLGDSDKLIPGDPIVAIGNPRGFDDTVSEGLISSVRVFCTPEQAAASQCPKTNNIDMKYLQISAPISQGSSGGALFNQAGEVVGVTTGIIDDAQAINIAMPGNYLRRLLAKPAQMAVAQFASVTHAPDEDTKDEEPAKIIRIDPGLTDVVYDGCGQAEVVQLVEDIEKAIESGAPLYNTRTKQGYEACYRIYEGTALKWKDGGKCKAVATAFEAGLARTTTLQTFNEKAWALRDTFDGLINAAKMWAQKHPMSP
jgi:S1-C subfamily serine protease|nr:S1C family serine protease [Kofleriaceae bacterium]